MPATTAVVGEPHGEPARCPQFNNSAEYARAEPKTTRRARPAFFGQFTWSRDPAVVPKSPPTTHSKSDEVWRAWVVWVWCVCAWACGRCARVNVCDVYDTSGFCAGGVARAAPRVCRRDGRARTLVGWLRACACRSCVRARAGRVPRCMRELYWCCLGAGSSVVVARVMGDSRSGAMTCTERNNAERHRSAHRVLREVHGRQV